MIRKQLTNDTSRWTYPAPLLNDVMILDLAGTAHPNRFNGLIDTGASRTVIPLSVCEDLRLSPRDWLKPQGFDPEVPKRDVPVYYLTIKICDIEEVSLLVYGIRRDNILLGRDFLSRLVFVIDSPSCNMIIGRHGFFTKSLLWGLPLR